MEATLANIAELVGGKIVAGDSQLKITGISSLAEASAGDISFLADDRYAYYFT